jgi:iron complex outermembrane receptor protein
MNKIVLTHDFMKVGATPVLRRIFWPVATGVLCSVLCIASPSRANEAVDTAAGDSSGEDSGLAEIVVTARRKDEKLEKVPVSVSAFSATDLAQQKITTEADLESSTPGLTVRQTNSSNQLGFALRGQAEDAFSYSSPTVLTYIDEFQFNSANSASAFYDLQSVQVLKGPQGTLFGRNATGGAVLYQTAQPTQEFAGMARIGVGNYEDKQGEFMLNLPLSSIAAFRIAGEFEKRDGFEHNLFLNLYEGSIDQKNIRATLLLTPFTGLSNTTTFQYGDSLGYSTGLKIQNAYPVGATYNGNTLADTSSLLYPPGSTEVPGFNGVASVVARGATGGFYNFYNDTTSRHDSDDRVVVNKTTYEVSSDLSLRNIVGFHDAISHDQSDVDGSPYQILTIGATGGPNAEGYTTGSRQYSDEFQVAGLTAEEKLNYIVGAYFSRDDEGEDIPLNVAADFPTGGLYGPGIRYDFVTKDISRAIYLQGSYEFIPGWHATGGFRETWEDSGIQHQNDDTYREEGVTNAIQATHKPSWTVGLDYQITPETLLYFAQRGSWRTGGFNGTSTIPDPAGGPNLNNEFKPETTYDFELGAKFAGTIASMPARINISVYDQTVDNIQRAVYIGVAAQTSNAKQARTSGVEFQAQIEPVRWLQLGTQMAYTDARYTDGSATAIDTSGVFHNLVLGPYGDTSKESGSVFVRVAPRLPGDLGETFLRIEEYAQSNFYYTNLANTLTPGTGIPGYALTNLQLGWNDIYESKVSVSAYARNLLNKEYLTGGLGLGAVIGSNATVPGTPRMYGLDLRVTF